MHYEEEITGRIKTLSLVPMKRDKNPYKEKSKSKDKKQDYSKARDRKRNWE